MQDIDQTLADFKKSRQLIKEDLSTKENLDSIFEKLSKENQDKLLIYATDLYYSHRYQTRVTEIPILDMNLKEWHMTERQKEIDYIIKELIKSSPSSDIYDIISSLGITIKHQAGKSFYCQIKGKKYIYLDTNLAEEIKPFVLAHELGHAVLHKEEIYHYSPLSITKTATEREADYFAFQILGLKIDPTYEYTVDQYAKLLNVNEDVIEYIAN